MINNQKPILCLKKRTTKTTHQKHLEKLTFTQNNLINQKKLCV